MDEDESYEAINLADQWSAWHKAVFWLGMSVGGGIWILLSGGRFGVFITLATLFCTCCDLYHLFSLQRQIREFRQDKQKAARPFNEHKHTGV